MSLCLYLIPLCILVLDRYDVRGTVYDLRPLEPLGGGASDALWSTLSDAERKVEQLCDEERYRALYHNEAEEAMYQGILCF